MATRMIVTSQPDVPCDVCGRRLLRGERPDVFLAGGRRRTVCELCAPRASDEGWLRETEQSHSLKLPPARPRRGHNLLERLRGLREPAEPQPAAEPPSAHAQAMEEPHPIDSIEPQHGDPARHGDLARQNGASGELGGAPGALGDSGALGRDPDSPSDPGEDTTTPLPLSSPSHALSPSRALSEDGAPEALHPPEDELPEDGSWRDAWMFVVE
jgi:hypothetical protein